MRQALALLFWSSALSNTLAQVTYEKIYNAGASGRFNLIELSGNGVLTTLAYAAGENVSGTSRLDSLGEVVHSQGYVVDTILVLQSVTKYSEDKYLFVGGYFKDTCISNPLGRNTYPVIG
jgi:hypothetical protein